MGILLLQTAATKPSARKGSCRSHHGTWYKARKRTLQKEASASESERFLAEFLFSLPCPVGIEGSFAKVFVDGVAGWDVWLLASGFTSRRRCGSFLSLVILYCLPKQEPYIESSDRVEGLDLCLVRPSPEGVRQVLSRLVLVLPAFIDVVTIQIQRCMYMIHTSRS